MGIYAEMANKHFGKWTARWPVGFRGNSRKHFEIVWLCSCDCGLLAVVGGRNLRRGTSKQCKFCKARYSNTKHGLRHTVEYLMLVAAKTRAKKKGFSFNIELQDIQIPDKCPLLGIPLMKCRGKAGQNSPSLDKIIPKLGYVKGNVQVISKRANTMKSNATLDEMKTLVTNWEKQIA